MLDLSPQPGELGAHAGAERLGCKTPSYMLSIIDELRTRRPQRRSSSVGQMRRIVDHRPAR